jgi:heat shock protein HslJ
MKNMWDEKSIFEVKIEFDTTVFGKWSSNLEMFCIMKNNVFTLLILLVVLLFSSCDKGKNKITGNIYSTWEVVEFMSVESESNAKKDNYNPVIEFKEDGSFSLKLDANNCSGNFSLADGNAIEMGGPGCTKMCCDSDFSNKLTTLLPEVKSYSFEENILKLNVPDWGWIKLELVSAP